MKKKIKKVKAWLDISKKKNRKLDMVYFEKKNPMFLPNFKWLADMLYKDIVPCTITYSLPVKKINK